MREVTHSQSGSKAELHFTECCVLVVVQIQTVGTCGGTVGDTVVIQVMVKGDTVGTAEELNSPQLRRKVKVILTSLLNSSFSFPSKRTVEAALFGVGGSSQESMESCLL